MFIALSATGARAQQIFYVNDDATGANNGSSWSDAYLTLQDAIAAATSGDQIWVAAGIYHPDDVGTPLDRSLSFALKGGVEIYGGFAGNESALNQRDLETSESILSGDLLADDVMIACSTNAECFGAGERCWHGACIRKTMTDDNSYTVVVADGVSSDTVFDGFTITGGRANGSAAPSEFARERFAGGMYVRFVDGSPPVPSEPVIRNCRFEWNGADEWGGAMYIQAPPEAPDGPLIQSCFFSRNSAFKTGELAAPLGGALSSNDTDARVEDCTFSRNVAHGGVGAVGGAIGTQNIDFFLALDRFPAMRISRCTFTQNLTDGLGGAMYDSHNDTAFKDCRFMRNQAGLGGGYANVGGSPSVINSIFVANAAVENSQLISSQSGGGLAMAAFPSSEDITIVNSLFLNNVAMEMGGGVYLEPGESSALRRPIVNTIFRGNTAGGSPSQVFVDGPAEGGPEVTFCNIEGGWSNADCPAGFTTCNIDADPVFVAPGAEDYRLGQGSPCLDAGDNDIVLALANSTDIAGAPRRADDCDTADTGRGSPPIVDIGPFESSVCLPQDIPTASSWGLLVMLLSLLVFGTIGSRNTLRPPQSAPRA